MRVIAGELKGRRLLAPTWSGLRPTSDKLRETLFNVLASRIAGARMLDAFAGTGAIGIEALSRGASHVTFIDSDPRAVKLIEQNVRRCGAANRCAIIRIRLGDAPPSWKPDPFDLAVLDPPYDQSDLTAALAAVEPTIAAGGLVVLEHARRRQAPEGSGMLRRVRALTSGDSALSFYETSAGPAPSGPR